MKVEGVAEMVSPGVVQEGCLTEDRALLVAERTYTAERVIHRHDHYQAVFPDRGVLDMMVDGLPGRVAGMQFALIGPGKEHRFWAGEANRFLVLDVAPGLLDAARHPGTERTDLARTVFRPVTPRLATMCDVLRAELRFGGLDDPLVRDALGAYASAVLGRPRCLANPPSVSSAGRLLGRRVRDCVEASCLQSFSLDDVAVAVGASVGHAQRSFRAEMGVSVVAYVQALRLRRAKEPLRVSDLSVFEVAAASGFRNQSYFGRLFAREVGMTPTRYRASMR